MDLLRVSDETARFCWGDTDSETLRAYVKNKWGAPNAPHDRMLASAVHLLKARGDWTTQDEIGTIPKPIRRPPGMKSIGGGPLAPTIPIQDDKGAPRAAADIAADAQAALKQGYARFPMVVSEIRPDRPNLLVPVAVKGSVAVLEGAVDCPSPGPGRAHVAIIETDDGFALAAGWEEILDGNEPWEPIAEFAGSTIGAVIERALAELARCDKMLAKLVEEIAADKAALDAAEAAGQDETNDEGLEDDESGAGTGDDLSEESGSTAEEDGLTAEKKAAAEQALADRNACAAAWRRRLGLEVEGEEAP